MRNTELHEKLKPCRDQVGQMNRILINYKSERENENPKAHAKRILKAELSHIFADDNPTEYWLESFTVC